MLALSRAGYRSRVDDVMRTTQRLQRGLTDLGLRILGTPAMGVFAATSDTVAVAALAEGLKQRGWWIDVQPNPASMHFIVLPRHGEVVEQFLADLAGVCADPPQTSASGASYGVMVRGELTRTSLLRHLDDRYDHSP